MNEAPPLPDEFPAPPIAYRDRRTGLILFGIAQIVLGVLSLLMVALVVIGQVMLSHSTGTPMAVRWIIPSILTYVLLAIALIWIGIGSIQCRRWARSLLLVFSWFWLGMGVLMVPMMAWLLPRILAKAPTGGQPMPKEAMLLIVAVEIVMVGVFFILLPGAFVLFYRSPHVKATCEARDPRPRWTDACPLPVLAVPSLLCPGAGTMVLLALTGFAVFPFFGTFLTGFPGGILMIGAATLFFWAARGCYRLQPRAWWTLLILILVFAVSGLLTFAQADLIELYEKMGYPQAQIDLMRQYNWMDGQTMMWISMLWILPILGYLLWIKRYFPKAS
jgi:hypothetical protein